MFDLLYSYTPILDFVSTVLSKEGVQCTELIDHSNLGSQNNSCFDCIVLDLTHLPLMSEALGSGREDSNTSSTVIIGVVADSDLQMVVRAMKAGINEVVSIDDAESDIVEIIMGALIEAVPPRVGTDDDASEVPDFILRARDGIRRYDEYEAEIFRFALKHTGGCISRAAGALGVGRATMYRKIRNYEIEVPPVRQRAVARRRRRPLQSAAG